MTALPWQRADVDITPPNDGDTLVYRASTGRWHFGTGAVERVALPLAFNTPGLVMPADAITAVVQLAKTFAVAGDRTARYVPGPCGVFGSTGNNGTYTVVSAVFALGTTTITVAEAIPDATADGSLCLTGPVGIKVTDLNPGDLIYGLDNNGDTPWIVSVPTAFDGATPVLLNIYGASNRGPLPTPITASNTFDLSVADVAMNFSEAGTMFSAAIATWPSTGAAVVCRAPTSLYVVLAGNGGPSLVDPGSTTGDAELFMVIERAQ